MSAPVSYAIQGAERARLFRKLKQEKREKAVLARSRGRLMQQLASSAPASPKLTKFFAEVNQRHCDNLDKRGKMLTILQDMITNSTAAPSRRRYTTTTMAFAITIATASFVCYNLLRNFLFLPSYSFLFRYFRPEMSALESYVTDMKKLPHYLQLLSDQMGPEKQMVEDYGGVLAVDAMSLRPHIFVTKDGFVQGVLGELSLNDTELMSVRQSYEAYEKYVASLGNKTITDSFVYMYQPLYSGAKCFTVFIEPSTQGKATGFQIDRLSELSELLQEHGFPIEGFAFDGDTTYSQLHTIFFNEYQQLVSQNASIRNLSVIAATSVVSDPLHLLKRARYRLLSSTVHGGFENTTASVISVDSLQSQLDLPSVVFNNEKYTKMHDALATRLFSLTTLSSLLENNNYSALAYFMPLCLLCASLQEANLMVEERASLLEVGFYYMLAYYRMLSGNLTPLKQRKNTTNQHVCPFDLIFVKEYCNTVCSILKVLYKVNGTVGLNRIGSNPVEHLFGLIRMRSHSVHTWDKMLRVVSKSLLQQRFIKNIGENERIDKRLSYFARDVLNAPSRLEANSLGMNPRDLAFTLHCVLGFPVTVGSLMVWDATSLFELRDEIFCNFRNQILYLATRCCPSGDHRLASTDIKVTSGHQIKPRLIDRKVI